MDEASGKVAARSTNEEPERAKNRRMKKLIAQFGALPRSMKWAVLFALAMIVYFFGIEKVIDSTNRLNQKADSLAAGLRKEAELLSPDSPKGRVLADGRRLFGEPLLPGDPGSRPEAVHSVVDKILDKHGVTKRQKNERRVPFRGDELTSLLGSAATQKTAERMVLDITFDASQDVVTAIVNDLEQAKEIALISRVDLRRPDAMRDTRGSAAPASGSQILKVTITPEAWIVSASVGAGGVR